MPWQEGRPLHASHPDVRPAKLMEHDEIRQAVRRYAREQLAHNAAYLAENGLKLITTWAHSATTGVIFAAPGKTADKSAPRPSLAPTHPPGSVAAPTEPTTAPPPSDTQQILPTHPDTPDLIL